MDSGRPVVADARACAGFPALDALASEAELRAWVDVIDTHSPNRSGDAEHDAYVDWLANRMTDATGVEPTVVRHAIDDRAIDGASLEVVAGGTTFDVPLAGPIPRTAFTDGVTLPLVYAPEPVSSPPVDRLLVRELPIGAIPADGLVSAAHFIHDPDGFLEDVLAPGARVQRPWMSGPIQNELRQLSAQGRTPGVIWLRTEAGPMVDGIWVQSSLLGFPSVMLAAPEASRLRTHLMEDDIASATLIVRGRDEALEARSLVFEVPGERGLLVVETHTDTLNAVQENGGAAMIALARWYAARPRACRPWTLRFELAAAHRSGLLGAIDARERATRDGAVGVLTFEHLGAREYVATPGGVEATGALELTALSLPAALDANSVKERVESRGVRAVIALPEGLGRFGEAKVFADTIPTAELISGPWIQNSPNAGPEAIDFEDMRAELGLLADLLLMWSP
ncbi:MAG: hypothetical protein AAF411_01670 [Myxococcota bacterium]